MPNKLFNYDGQVINTKLITTSDTPGLLDTGDKVKIDNITAHINNTSNPHGVTLSQLGVTAAAAKLNFTSNVTSDIQTQLNNKAGTATATTSANGLMSSADKTKLDGIATNANNYTHPTTHAATMIVEDASHRFVTDTEKSTWNGKAGTSVATTTANGLMSSSDKTKLDGIATNANNYTHPTTHPASIIVQDANNRFVTDTEKSTWNGKASTAVATTSANGLMSAAMVTKLNGIATGANAYTHPSHTAKGAGLYKITVDAQGHVSAASAVAKADITALGIPGQDTVYTLPLATASALGGVKIGYAASGKNYAVQLDTDGKMFVNVPWTDNNNTYTLSSFGITATAAELNILDGVTATATELNYVDGVTSNIQTQLNAKSGTDHTHSTYMANKNAVGTGSFSMNKLANSTTGSNSTVLGSNCKAEMSSCLAEGSYTYAAGNYAHAEGYYTTALNYQHVEGHYNNISNAPANSNATGTGTGTAFSIGNGASASAKSNAFRVTYDGVAYAKSALITTGVN